jgi:hypothetical protein
MHNKSLLDAMHAGAILSRGIDLKATFKQQALATAKKASVPLAAGRHRIGTSAWVLVTLRHWQAPQLSNSHLALHSLQAIAFENEQAANGTYDPTSGGEAFYQQSISSRKEAPVDKRGFVWVRLAWW